MLSGDDDDAEVKLENQIDTPPHKRRKVNRKADPFWSKLKTAVSSASGSYRVQNLKTLKALLKKRKRDGRITSIENIITKSDFYNFGCMNYFIMYNDKEPSWENLPVECIVFIKINVKLELAFTEFNNIGGEPDITYIESILSEIEDLINIWYATSAQYINFEGSEVWERMPKSNILDRIPFDENYKLKCIEFYKNGPRTYEPVAMGFKNNLHELIRVSILFSVFQDDSLDNINQRENYDELIQEWNTRIFKAEEVVEQVQEQAPGHGDVPKSKKPRAEYDEDDDDDEDDPMTTDPALLPYMEPMTTDLGNPQLVNPYTVATGNDNPALLPYMEPMTTDLATAPGAPPEPQAQEAKRPKTKHTPTDLATAPGVPPEPQAQEAKRPKTKHTQTDGGSKKNKNGSKKKTSRTSTKRKVTKKKRKKIIIKRTKKKKPTKK